MAAQSRGHATHRGGHATRRDRDKLITSMPDIKIRRALIAVYDKTGVAEFARALVEEFGVEIISTGGTAKHLKEHGIPVTLVEEVTGFPEMLDGRVKTLHPKIHAAILADRDNPEHMRQLEQHGIKPIDMVVVNLYPFEKTVADPNCKFEDAIEMIDIGGPCLLRAAAKNHRHVWVVHEPRFYELALERLRGNCDELILKDSRLASAFGAYWTTTGYDAAVSTFLSSFHADESNLSAMRFLQVFRLDGANEWGGGVEPRARGADVRVLRFWNFGALRYGENPHQKAELLQVHADRSSLDLTAADASWSDSQPALSHNNYLDADAALGLCAELARAAGRMMNKREVRSPHVCVFIKHTNPCGVGVSDDSLDAYRRAYLGDPNAAMGCILAVNFPVDAEFAAAVMETYDRLGKPLKDAGHPAAPGGFFIEVWVAPSFDEDAVAVIRGTAESSAAVPNPPKKTWGEKVRLLAVGDMTIEPDPKELDYKRIAGGMLVQTRDLLGLNEDQWKVVTKRAPTEREMADLRLAWLICKHTKSNAISICKDGMLIGNGAGQMSRVMSCRIATWLAKENGHADMLAGSVAASDAFFPFRDGPDILMDAGVTAIIQPGGSKRDEETIAACDERGVAMIFTGTRHFKH